MFFVVEGGDFTGKSSAVQLASEAMQDLVIVNDPSTAGLPLASAVREHIIGQDNAGSRITEVLGFLLARSELNAKLIEPALLNKKIVLCDRYAGSSLAYQVFGRQALDSTRTLIADKRWTLPSETTFILTVSDEVRAIRKEERLGKQDAFDKMKTEFHDRVAEGYEFLKTDLGMRLINTKEVIEIDTSHLTVNEVANTILFHIKSIINEFNRYTEYKG